jgi:hypothetical protein
VTAFPSFKKQLSNYQFRRITRGTFLDHYYHPSFTRSDLSAVRTMQPKPAIRHNRSTENKENIPDLQNVPMIDWQSLLTPICSNNNSQDSFYPSENSTAPYSPPLLTSLDNNDYSQGSYYDYNTYTPLATHQGGNEYSQQSNNNSNSMTGFNMNSSELSEFDDFLFAST